MNLVTQILVLLLQSTLDDEYSAAAEKTFNVFSFPHKDILNTSKLIH